MFFILFFVIFHPCVNLFLFLYKFLIVQSNKKAFYGQSYAASASNNNNNNNNNNLMGLNHGSRNYNYNNKYALNTNSEIGTNTDTVVTTEKYSAQSWGYQVLPSLYSIYQKVVVFC